MLKLIALFAALGIAVTGCTVNEIMTAEETELALATEPVPEDLLLDIGIIEFDAGIPEDNDPEDSGIYPEVREAEARYVPYHLKQTLQSTGLWGAVRVVPSEETFTDLIVNGTLIESDGENIEVDIRVKDVSGREWFRKRYETQTGLSSYSVNRDRRMDPYQKVYNDFANDLYEYALTLTADDKEELRQISELKFFADMSPLAFGQHLQEDDNGILKPVRLPAENDPTVQRLRQIRERDRLVVDTLNEHYANFYYGIAIPYHDWRKISREERINYRQVQRAATMQSLIGVAVLAGSIAMDTDSSSSSRRRVKRQLQNVGIAEGFGQIFQGFTRRSESKIHLEAIEELSESFGSEASPMVIEVQGETRRLTGTAAAQYEDWRRLLRDIYQAETGFSGPVDVGAPARATEPSG